MSSESSSFISDERVVPRGLVHRRMMEFDQQSHHNISHSDSPSSSFVNKQSAVVNTVPQGVQSSGRTHIVVGCRPTITNYLSDEDFQIERRTVYRRSIDGEPHITIQQTALRSRSKSPRSYPVVTVKVTDPDEQSRSIAQSAFPPNQLYSTVIPIERVNESLPVGGLATKKAIQVEQSDEVSRTYRNTPRREHSLYEGRHYSTPNIPSTSGYCRVMSAEELRSADSYRNPIHAGPTGSIIEEDDLDMETDEEVQLRENELKQAKQTIRNLAVELARLERDKKMLEIETSLNEEKAEAKVASSMADYIEHMRRHSDQYEQHQIYENTEKDSLDVVDLIASDCQRMLTSLKENERSESTDEDNNNYQRSFRSFPMGLNSIMDAHDRRPSTSSDSSQILSLKDQSVAYSSSGNIQNTLISRLERELTDAQSTNHRLNAQLGNLVSSGNSTLKKEMQDLKRDLKSSRDEVDQLKKKLQKAERDRQQWDSQKKTLESKLPIDVQLLMAQKRELTMQLDREQNEKHELFLQINSMIAQLADSGDVERYKEENRSLKKKLDDSEMISSSESSRFKEEARKLQEEMDIGRRTFEFEKRKLQSDTEELRKELNMKAAALQSLMLAKQDSGKLDKLTEENRQINEQLETVREELEERTQTIQQLEKKLASSSSAESEVERFKRDLQDAKEESENERMQKENFSKSIDELNRKLSSVESSAEEFKKMLKEKEQKIEEVERNNKELQEVHHNEFASLRQEATQKSTESTDLQHKIKILETTLLEKDSKIDTTKVSLLAAESKVVQAEADLRNLDQQLKNSERRAQQLESQLSAAGDGEKEVELLREQLKKAEERYDILMNRQQKADSNNQELLQTLRADVSRLESELAEAERENKKVEETQRQKAELEEDYCNKVDSLQESLKTAAAEKQNRDKRVEELEKQLKETESERKKLESKASVADELTTLMSSLQAVRIENGQYQDEISALHSELSEYREEREQTNEEIDGLHRKNEELIKQKETLEQTVEKERIRISELDKEKDNLESAESERLKLETMMEAMERTSSELVKGITEKEKQLDELKSKSEERSREMREELDALKAKLESAQKRNTELEEERKRVVGSGDEEKQRLLGEITVLREKADSSHLEAESLKSKLVSANELCTSHEEKEKSLEERIKVLEKEYEEAKAAAAANSAETACKARDAERMGEKIKLQLEELEKEQKVKEDENRRNMESLEQEIEELRRREKEFEAVKRETQTTETRKNEESMKEMDHLREQLTEAVKRADSTEKTRDELISQMKTMTDLMEQEAKRIEDLNNEKKRLQERFEEVEAKLAADKTPELTTENSRLKAEIQRLQEENQKELEASKGRANKETEEQLKLLTAEKTKLTSELMESKSRVEQLNRSIVSAEKKKKDELAAIFTELGMVKDERARLQDKIDNMYANGTTGTQRSVSNMSFTSNYTMADFSEIDDVDILRGQIDKQKRLIIVLRRKLQGLQPKLT